MLRTDRSLRPAALLMSVLVLLFAVAPLRAEGSGFRPDNEELYFSALTDEIREEVKTGTVYIGDFVQVSTCRGDIIYDNETYCVNRLEGNVRYLQTMVTNGQWVKRGDPLIRVVRESEDGDIGNLRSEIESLEQNLEEYISVNLGLLEKYADLKVHAASVNDRRIAGLLYERLERAYKKEYEARLEEIDELCGRMNNLERDGEELFIAAESEGEVRDLARFKSRDMIWNYAYICRICDTRSFRVRVSGGASGLGYNMPVTVTQAQNEGAVSVEGIVRTCRSAVLSPGLIGNDDIIEITGDPAAFGYGRDVTVSYKAVDVKGVVLVDRNAVYFDDKGDYVYILSNGSRMKRYIKKGATGSSSVWVLSGLSEGDIVIIK